MFKTVPKTASKTSQYNSSYQQQAVLVYKTNAAVLIGCTQRRGVEGKEEVTFYCYNNNLHTVIFIIRSNNNTNCYHFLSNWFLQVNGAIIMNSLL